MQTSVSRLTFSAVFASSKAFFPVPRAYVLKFMRIRGVRTLVKVFTVYSILVNS